MRSIRAIGTISALLFAAMAVYTSSLEPSIPSIQLTFSELGFSSILSRWNPSQVELFKRHFLIDYPFLVSYGLLGYRISRGTGLFARLTQYSRTLLSFTLPAAAAADAAENSLHLLFVYGVGPFSEFQYFAAGAAAMTKWLLLVIFIAFAVYAKFKTAG